MRNASTNTSPIRIFLLGRFEVTWKKKRVQANQWKRRKAAALLQWLALERLLLKGQAIEFLWPETEPIVGANNLYRTLYALRKTLTEGLALDTPEAVFTFDNGRLRLNEDVWVDVQEFKQLLAAKPAPADALQQAIALYQGELLPDDRYSEWTQTLRLSLRRAYREACLALAEHHRRHGRYADAIALLTPLLPDDPADEPVHRSLMRLYALAGRRHDALRQYQTCVDALAAELDLSPSPVTEKAYDQILSGELPLQLEPTSSEALLQEPSADTETDPLPPAPMVVEAAAGGSFVDRRAELEKLQAALTVTQKKQGGAILLAGDTGIGKTRLAYEALRLAAGAGLATLYGAVYEEEGQMPYQPFIEAFNRYLAEQKRPLTDNPITHFQPSHNNDVEQEQWALFHNVAAFLSQLSAPAGAVLLVDDLHAADDASRQLFHYLARHTRHTPIILLATYRTDLERPAQATFASLLNALYRERLRTLIQIPPLSADAVTAIVTEIWHGEVEAELLQTLANVSEGNPFYAEEMTRALLHSDRVEQVAGRWRLKSGASLPTPAGLGALLRQKVNRLGTAVTTTLEIAAVIGRQFNFGLLRQVSPLSERELLDSLDTALAARLIAESDEGYRFQHGLIRRVLYEGLSRARRTHLHTRVADALETI